MKDSEIRAAAQRLLSRWPPRVRIEDHAEVRRAADGVVFIDAVVELREGDVQGVDGEPAEIKSQEKP